MERHKEHERLLKLYELLEELLYGWYLGTKYWDNYEDYYLNQLIPELQSGEASNIKTESDLIEKIRSVATEDEWAALPRLARRLVENAKRPDATKIEQIKACINSFRFEEAEKLILGNPGLIRVKDFKTMKAEASEKFQLQFQKLLDSENLGQARQLLEEFGPYLPNAERQQCQRALEEKETRIRRQQLKGQLKRLIEHEEFAQADELFRAQSLIPQEEYEGMKSEAVERYLCEVDRKLCKDREKALAISKMDQYVLVKARAGSGKTTAIACKVSWLIEKEGVDPDRILVLAFNRKAAKEIGDRIQKRCKSFSNARTFHGLAYQLVSPSQKPLFDEKDDPSVRKQSQFVQNLLSKIWDPSFHLKLYTFFRRELQEIESWGAHLSKEDLYLYRKNLVDITLNGEKVKSRGEKYIADFLFEHGIDYHYEQFWRWGRQPYRPDFTIKSQDCCYVIEHWGIDENKPPSGREERKRWEEYRQQMQEKREFWRGEKDVIFLETSVRDLQGGREAFEEILYQKLTKAGLRCQKLPPEELYEKVRNIHLTRMTELFLHFIQQAKKRRLKPEDIKEKAKSIEDPRTRAFWELAYKVYSAYKEELDRTGGYDFDDLLEKAIEEVKQTRGSCKIPTNGRLVAMNELEWIMIDEYQDFSSLFYALIDEIRKYNPGVKIFCVGDDWQAINGFAGSDLRYFREFAEHFGSEQSGTATLLTNYRSREQIVENANAFMEAFSRGIGGETCRPRPDFPGGKVVIEYIDDVRVKPQTGADELKQDDSEGDARFLLMGKGRPTSQDLILAKYLKKCHEVIINNPRKTIAILSRTNQFYGLDLREFEKRLIASLTDEERKRCKTEKEWIGVHTVHSFKGLERDVIVILQACERVFPLIHPDEHLFAPLGRTIGDVIDEERHLFYVAITRAKEQLWILTERGRESGFLSHLRPTKSIAQGKSLLSRDMQACEE
jgi:DNA helicase-4